MRLLLFAFLWLAIGRDPSVAAEHLGIVAQWSTLDYAFPNDPEFLRNFRPENVVPSGVEITRERIFVSTPRLRLGIPATFSFFPRNVPAGSSPQLQAYPSWDWHSAGKGQLNCSQMISVYRSKVDRCNRLWVLDAGVMTSIDDFTPVCAPKLMVFDLRTDRLVRFISFPREVLRPNSLMTNLVIDDTTAMTCDDVFVYMTDTAGPGILVFDGSTDKSWRVFHPSMLPHPDFTQYRIGVTTFELPDGILGLAMSDRSATVYYQPLATDRLYSVPTSVLRAGPLPFRQQLPVTLVGRKSSQSVALAVDPRDDAILFSPLTETAVAAWNPQADQQRILAYDPDRLQFTAEIRWAAQENGGFWAMSTRFHKFFLREASDREINVRIMRLTEPAAARNSPAVLSILGHRFPGNYYNNTLGY